MVEMGIFSLFQTWFFNWSDSREVASHRSSVYYFAFNQNTITNQNQSHQIIHQITPLVILSSKIQLIGTKIPYPWTS